MADWYVYQHDAAPLGPISTELLSDAILAGRISPESWVAAPGGPKWIRALDVPVIARVVNSVSLAPRRRDSGLRFVPKELVPAATPALGIAAIRDDLPPPTEPMSASSLPTKPASYRGGDTLESAGNDRRATK